MMFDSGSQDNLIFENIVKSLNLEIVPHHKSYPLGWVCDNAQLHVTRKCKLEFAIIIKFIDDIDYEAFDGCNLNLKTDLVDVVNQSDEMFQY